MVVFNVVIKWLITVCLTVGFCCCEMNEENGSDSIAIFSNPMKQTRKNIHVKGYENQNVLLEGIIQNPYAVKTSQNLIDSPSHVKLDDIDQGSINLTKGFQGFKGIYDECKARIRDKSLNGKLNGNLFLLKDGLNLKDLILSLYNCVKVQSFRRLDEFLSGNIIPVSRYVKFVRNDDFTNEISNSIAGGMRSENYTLDVLSKDWIDLILDRLQKLLQGHYLNIRLDENQWQEHGRRRDHRMFAMMIMGFVIMASILVPMGFQFLTVLGGKSLLMAKMALIMSAINGLKKIAASSVGYGLYHTGPDAFHLPQHHGFHDKVFRVNHQDHHNLPFNSAI